MKRTLLALLVVIIAVTGANLTLGAAGKGSANPQATVMFMNGPGDNIQSDGKAYVGGVGGVVAEMQGGTTILVNIATTGGKTKRYFWFHYPAGTEVQTACDSTATMGPTSAASGVYYPGFVNIKSLGAIQIGETRAVRIHFGAPAGQFLWLSAFNVLQQCSGVVAAYRQDQSHWQVATTSDRLTVPTTEYHGFNPFGMIADAELNWVMPSPISVLQGVSSTFLGNYAMPFGLTVYCPTCAAPVACPSWSTGSPCAIPKS